MEMYPESPKSYQLASLIHHHERPSSSDASETRHAPWTRLEEIETRFTGRKHVQWPELRSHSRQWVVEQQLVPPDMALHTDALRYTDLVSGYYLDSTFPALAAITDFSIWFFHWDDYHQICASRHWDDRWRTLGHDLRAALTTPDSYLRHPEPLVAAMADSLLRLFDRTPSNEWRVRFTAHMHDVFDAFDREYRDRVHGTVLTAETYVPHRRFTFGHWIWIDLMELSARHELPPAVRDHDAYRRAGLASQDFSAWYNDLYSMPKELAADETHNLGIILKHHEGLSTTEACAELRRRLTNQIAEFLRAEQEVIALQAQLSPMISDTVGACLFNMRQWFPAVYWFHVESSRYRLDEWDSPTQPPYVNQPAAPHRPQG